MRTWLVVAVCVLASVAAGCTTKDDAEPTSIPLTTSIAAPPPRTTLLRVLVITDEYLPIEDARVSVVGLGLNGTTDNVGNAYFQIGKPGRYSVHVHRSGFYPNISKVVVDGAAKQVERITLLDAPHDAYYSDFRYYDGVCGPTVIVDGTSDSQDCADNEFFERPRPTGWFLSEGLIGGHILLEFPESPAGSARMRVTLAFPEAGAFADGSDVLVAQGPSPLRLNFSNDMVTPAMKKNGVPIDIHIGLPEGEAASVNLYQEFELQAQFDYYVPAPNVDHH